MDLTHDWRSFQGLFYPHRRASSARGGTPSGPVFLVLNGDFILSAFAEHEDLSDWVGASYAEVSARTKHRQMIAYTREQVEKWVQESLSIPHFYGQVEFLRKQATPEIPFHRHFLVEAMHSWWGKVLPSSYGLFVRVEGQNEKNFLLIVRRGVIDGLSEPDLTSMGAERRRQPADVVKYLSEKYLVPVQGMFVPAHDWAEWSSHERPWKELARSVRANRTKLVPFRWSLAVLGSTRAFFGV